MYSLELQQRLNSLLQYVPNTFKHNMNASHEFRAAVCNLSRRYAQNDEKRMGYILEDEVILHFANTGKYIQSDADFYSDSSSGSGSDNNRNWYNIIRASPILIKYKDEKVDYEELFRRGLFKKRECKLFTAHYIPERILESLSDESIIELNALRIKKRDLAFEA